jgi:hypothetical protein
MVLDLNSSSDLVEGMREPEGLLEFVEADLEHELFPYERSFIILLPS